MSTTTKRLAPDDLKNQPPDAAKQHGNSGRDYSHLKPHQWRPGQSGNPAGRPAGSGKLIKCLQDELAADGNALVEDLVNRLIYIALNGPDAIALKAIIEILDRTEGLPVKRIEVTETRHMKLVTLEDEGDDEDEELERVRTV